MVTLSGPLNLLQIDSTGCAAPLTHPKALRRVTLPVYQTRNAAAIAASPQPLSPSAPQSDFYCSAALSKSLLIRVYTAGPNEITHSTEYNKIVFFSLCVPFNQQPRIQDFIELYWNIALNHTKKVENRVVNCVRQKVRVFRSKKPRKKRLPEPAVCVIRFYLEIIFPSHLHSHSVPTKSDRSRCVWFIYTNCDFIYTSISTLVRW